MPFPTPQYMITPVANSNLQHSPVDWLTSPIVRHKNRKFKPLCKTEPIAIAPWGTTQHWGWLPQIATISPLCNFFWNAGPIREWDRDHLESHKVQHKLRNGTRQLSRWPYAAASTFSHPLNASQHLQMTWGIASFLSRNTSQISRNPIVPSTKHRGHCIFLGVLFEPTAGAGSAAHTPCVRITSKAMSPSKKKVAQALNDNQTTSRLKLNCWASMPNAHLLAMQRWNRIHTWRQWVNGAICTFRPALLLSASVSEVTLLGRPDWGGEGYAGWHLKTWPHIDAFVEYHCCLCDVAAQCGFFVDCKPDSNKPFNEAFM